MSALQSGSLREGWIVRSRPFGNALVSERYIHIGYFYRYYLPEHTLKYSQS